MKDDKKTGARTLAGILMGLPRRIAKLTRLVEEFGPKCAQCGEIVTKRPVSSLSPDDRRCDECAGKAPQYDSEMCPLWIDLPFADDVRYYTRLKRTMKASSVMKNLGRKQKNVN